MLPGSSTGECKERSTGELCSQKSRKVVVVGICLMSRMMLQLVPRDGLVMTWPPKMK